MKNSKRDAYVQTIASNYEVPQFKVLTLLDDEIRMAAKLYFKYTQGQFGIWNLTKGGDIWQ